MKKLFFTVCAGTQVLLIVLYIHKSSTWMRESYRKQHLEQDYKMLCEHHQKCRQDLYCAKNQADVKEFAKKNLNMTSINLVKQVKPLPRT